MRNYDEALAQLRAAGLKIQTPITTGRLVRCKVDGDHEKRGWYFLREWQASNGDVLLVGSFGIAYGADPNAVRGKIELAGRDLSDAEKAAFRKMLAEDRRRAEAARKAEAEDAAQKASARWRELSQDGDSAYLIRKRVSGYSVRYTPEGEVAVPMADASGKLWGLQFIRAAKDRDGRDKDFWPAGLAKKGHFHLIGPPSWIVLVAEGYATAASLHAATQYPVAVAFDAGNLQPVAEALRKRYGKVRILICADDDAFARCLHCKAPLRISDGAACPACGQPHQRKNAGIEYAAAASLAVSGAWVKPTFSDDADRWQKFEEKGTKLTDFNDLHILEGIGPIARQIEVAIANAGWSAPIPVARGVQPGGEGSDEIRPFSTSEDLLERFSLIYGGAQTVFDHQEHMLLGLSDMRDACLTRETHRRWMESPEKKIVRMAEVGFDPAESDPAIRCNLWGGWPTKPKSGRCEALLELLQFLCSAENDPAALYDWVLKWLAVPIQQPGAKMKTALVLHGPQGAGKNLFFEAYMAIFGLYGRVVDQSAVEDKFNDWASRKLFLIADEVVARQELYHINGKVKALITGDWIRINPKNVAAHDERNHVNIVFLSNEVQPIKVEEGDRRFTVIWTPPKLSPHFYGAVKTEIAAGGVEALHDHLLNLPLGDFANWTNPPMTRSKAELIDIGLDSCERFWKHYTGEHIDGIKPMPTKSDDLFDLYRAWCPRVGIGKASPSHILLARIGKRPDVKKGQARYMAGSATKLATFVLPPGHHAPPEGEGQLAWLTRCVEASRNAISDYKGSAYA